MTGSLVPHLDSARCANTLVHSSTLLHPYAAPELVSLVTHLPQSFGRSGYRFRLLSHLCNLACLVTRPLELLAESGDDDIGEMLGAKGVDGRSILLLLLLLLLLLCF